MLKACDLKITFNPGTPIETRALQGLSLEIPTGQFVTVIGTNGAGKSTFLNAVSGDLPVDRKSTRLNSSHVRISYAVFCLKKKSVRRDDSDSVDDLRDDRRALGTGRLSP